MKPDEDIIRITRPKTSSRGLFEPGDAVGPDGMPLVSKCKGDKAARLAELDAWTQKCARCPLHEGRKSVVFGTGDPDARLVFVGEGPGANEDEQGLPFVGRAGAKLNEIVAAMGLKREDVYIANIVKCRPPGNRTPAPAEALTCIPILHEQLEVIAPEVIVALGRPASCTLLETRRGINELRGRFHEYRGVPLMPTYHPAYLLRAYTPENRRRVWSDMQQVMARLGLSPS